MNGARLPLGSARFRPSLFLSLLLLIPSRTIADTAFQWTKGGPANSWVSQIVVDPASSRTLYAVADHTACKSTDGGRHWNPLAVEFALGRVSAVAVDPASSSRIFIGTDSGVFLSTDAGTSWKANPLVIGNSISIDPSLPNTIYVSSPGTFAPGLYRTLDGGSNWSLLSFPVSSGPLAAFAVGPDGTVFVGFTSGAIFRSLDRGESWTPAGLRFLRALNAIVADPRTPTTLYALTLSGFFRSVDSGDSWELRGGGSPSSLAIDPTNTSILYAGAQGGVWRTLDAGKTWLPLGVGPPFSDSSSVVALAIDPQSPATIYSGTFSSSGRFSQGLFKSDDRGATWMRSDKGLPGQLVGAIVTDPVSPAVVYAGTQSPAQPNRRGKGGAVLYKSGNAGADWGETGAPDLDKVAALAIDPVTPTTLYVGTSLCGTNFGGCNGKLLKSTNGASSWSEVLTGAILALAIDRQSPATLYAGIGCINLIGCRSVKSTDGGATWVELGGFPGAAYQFLPDPVASGVLYLASSTGPFNSSRVFKSTDGGASWNAAGVGLSSAISRLAIDGGSPETLYAATLAGLFKSTDGGGSWSATGLALPTTDLAIDPRDPDVLYAATDGGGVLRSSDRGTTWLAINSGLPVLVVDRIVIDSAGAYLHVTTGAGGVYDLQLPRLIHEAPPRPTHAVVPRTP
jgi:photosystem II stability/assembly factor-like uncharacterized protein